MSYDLYLDRSTVVTSDEFRAFFTQLPHCKAENTQAVYQNDDTGVYFLFDLATEPDDEGPSFKISFNLNYFRPHFFGIEAAPILRAVIDGFGFTIHDPQNDGMGDGPFTEEGFLRGWNKGNAFGYRAILRSDKPPKEVYARPREETGAIWRWNYEKENTQQTFGERIFVPRIFCVVADGALCSAAVWPDGIAELVPAVDLYFIDRDRLAPRRLFTRKKDSCLVRRSELEAALGPFESTKYPLPCRLFDHQEPSKEVRKFVGEIRSEAKKSSGLAMDQVLDRELVEESSNR